MARTFSTLVAGLGVGLFPALSFGLGLGDIQVESRLNQRLHARIEIVDVSDEEWQQIRARIAPRNLLSDAAVHPEILESLNLRALEDANHRHFIEVTSTDVLTEPLFDLPIAVAGPSLQVVRNYSVLLDPASADDTPQSAAGPGAKHEASAHEANSGGTSNVASARPTAVARVGKHARVARHHRSVSARKHSSAPSKVVPVKGLEQQQLEGQLATLQQMLSKMQDTIAAQDAEISKLTAQVAARTESQVTRKASPPQLVAVSAGAGASEARTRSFGGSHPLVYRLAGIVAGMVVLVLGGVAFIRRRHSPSLREAFSREGARKDTPGAEPRSDVLAWQTRLRAAQTGTWPAMSEDSGETHGAVDAAGAMDVADASDGRSVPPSPATVDPEATTVANTVAIDELTANLATDLDALTASYESEHVHSSSTPAVEEWRVQKEMLERDYLADTEALPFVLDEGNQVKSSRVEEPTEEQPIPPKRSASQDTVTDIASARTARHREVVEILEQTLDFEPHRVDVQLKLLEIYHQQALGNRDNFEVLLNKLGAARQELSPAQLLHLETLQRSLHDGKPDADPDPDFVTEVAI